MLGNIADRWLLNYSSTQSFYGYNHVSHNVYKNFLFKSLGARNLEDISQGSLTAGHPPYRSDRITGNEGQILVDSDLNNTSNSAWI